VEIQTWADGISRRDTDRQVQPASRDGLVCNVALLSVSEFGDDHRRLAKIEEAPWVEWRRTGMGREPINARGLADLLRPWRIKSRNGREDGTGNVAKGYYAEDLADAWERHSRYTAQMTNHRRPAM
jgi:hypothetical protein